MAVGDAGGVEPIPAPRGPGRLIMLNGASSSGKSTLAKSLQSALPEPFLHVSSDQFVAAGMVPDHHDDGGPFDWWHQVRPRFFAGFHRCLPALTAASNDLIVDHIIEFPTWRTSLAQLLADTDTVLVGVHCQLAELDRREQARGDRHPGEGRAHVLENQIHAFGPYDYEVDTTGGITSELVDSLIQAWRARPADRALQPAPAKEN